MVAVDGPLIEDKLAARLSVYYNNDKGYFRNYLGGPVPNARAPLVYGATLGALDAGPGIDDFEDFGRAETWIVRPSLTFTPSDGVELYLAYEHFDSEDDGPASQNHQTGTGSTNVFFTADRHSFDFSVNERGFYKSNADSLTAELKFDVGFGDGTITNVFGWRDTEGTTAGDIDATPLSLFHSGSSTAQDQLSNEIRYNGTFGAAEVTTGFYWFTQDLAYTERRAILGGFQNFSGGGRMDHDVIGIFGQVDYNLSDALVFTVGGRWTDETKDAEISNIRANGNISATTFGVPGCGVVEGTCPVDFADKASWSNFTPKVGLTFAASDSVNVYAHWTQGVRSGGYNFRNTSTTVFDPGPWDEEKVNAFEIGTKAQTADGRGTLNAAVYYNDMNGMQREVNLPDAVTGVVQIIGNTADATIWGFEAEGRYAVSDSLLLTGYVGYTNGEYDKIFRDISGTNGVIDSADFALEIPRLVPWTYGAGFVHSLPLGEATVVNTRFSYSHRDRSFYTDNNLGSLNALDIIDASISLSLMDGKADLSLYGKNLLHEVNHGGDTQLPASLGGGTFSPLNKGRIVGLELNLKY